MHNLPFRYLVSAAVLVFGLSSSASAAVDPGQYLVCELRIEGNELISNKEILGVMKTHAGDRFSRKEIAEDLKAINNLGYFDERNLEVNPELVDGKVRLTIKVEENALVKSFSVRGNTVVDSAEILEPFLNQAGKPQNASRLSEAITKVESKYHDRGYVLAKVKDVIDSPNGNMDLVLDEGIIDRLEISGEPKSSHGQIKRALSFMSGSVYNEKRLTNELRIFYSKGKFGDLRRSLVPSEKNKERYILKISLEPSSSAKSSAIANPQNNNLNNNLKGKGVVLSPNFISRISPAPFYVFEVEELYEHPQYGFELIRYASTADTPLTSGTKDSVNGRKLVWRKLRLNQFLVNNSDYHIGLIIDSNRQRRRILQKPAPIETYLGRAGVYCSAPDASQERTLAGPVLRSILLMSGDSSKLIVK